MLAALLPVLALALVNEAGIRLLGDKVYLLGSTRAAAWSTRSRPRRVSFGSGRRSPPNSGTSS
ncbi:hypothetical protein NKG94_20235 [Micromonospora sp. M12]